jgi:flagellin
MGLRINTNVLSLNAQRNLSNTTHSLSKALERLSSGARINRAGDDAAGLAISEGLQSQVRGLKVAVRNANDAVGFLNTAEGALGEITNITQRIRELAIQAANGTLSVTDRNYLESEKDALIEEFNRIAAQTSFNGVVLLDGSFQTSSLQVGVNKGETISFSIGDARASSMGALASISGWQGSLLPYTYTPNLSINGISIDAPSASDDTKSTGANQFSAIALASQINEKTSQTNVKAEVQTNVVTIYNTELSATTWGNTIDAGFKINDVSVSGSGITSAQKFVDTVNAFSNSTGVKARIRDGTTNDIQLFAEDGRNIEVTFSAQGYSAGGWAGGSQSTFALALMGSVTNYGAAVSGSGSFYSQMVTAAGAYTGGSAISTADVWTSANTVTLLRTGSIRLVSSSQISISGPTDSNMLGFAAGSYAVNANSAINLVDLSSQSGATEAINVADAALKQITNLRANLGAIQNRLDSTTNNIGVMLENISAARSQIRDADIAEETAELTRAQILQQAGVAVLSQANSASQIALSLLRF